MCTTPPYTYMYITATHILADVVFARHQVVELVLLRLTQSAELLDAIVRLVEVTCQVEDARLLLAILAF